MKTICTYCHKEIDRPACRVKKGHVYCNNSCHLKYEYEHGIKNRFEITKQANKKIREMARLGTLPILTELARLKIKAKQQTTEYRLKQSFSKQGPKNGMYGKFGSLHPAWSQIKCKCLQCGKIFYRKKSRVQRGENKYCSDACRFAAMPSAAVKKCMHCNKIFTVQNHRKESAFYCSYKCSWEAKSGKNSTLWKGGKSFEPYTPEFNNQLKKHIRERDGYRCRYCGIYQNELKDNHRNGQKLHVHHIDYDKTNNGPENLIALCNRCHRKTGQNRPYWQSYFTNLMQGGLEAHAPYFA